MDTYQHFVWLCVGEFRQAMQTKSVFIDVRAENVAQAIVQGLWTNTPEFHAEILATVPEKVWETEARLHPKQATKSWFIVREKSPTLIDVVVHNIQQYIVKEIVGKHDRYTV